MAELVDEDGYLTQEDLDGLTEMKIPQTIDVYKRQEYLPRVIYSFLTIAYSKTNRKGQCQVSSVSFVKKYPPAFVVLAERMSCAGKNICASSLFIFE